MVPVTNLPSHLPDLCLSNIFKRVPLDDLLRSVRVVCTNWHRVVRSELKRGRELVLIRDFTQDVDTVREDEQSIHRANPFRSNLIHYVRRENGSPWLRLRPLGLIRFDALLLPGRMLTERFTTPLMDTLPSITQLTMVQRQITSRSIIPALEQLVRLLTHYRDHLVSFKLNIAYTRYVTEVNRAQLEINCTALFNAINQLQSLRLLTLNVDFPGVDFFPIPLLSALSRLDTFASNYNDIAWLMSSILEHATERVRIDSALSLLLDRILALDLQLASRFTSVHVFDYLTVADYDNIRLFGARFISISHLTLSIMTMPLTMLARCLSPLTQLVHLELNYAEYISEDEQPQPEYVQLSSVGLLSLRITTRSHLDTERLHLAQIFPNLQGLSLNQAIDSCDQCEYEYNQLNDPNFRSVIRSRVLPCIRLSRQPFSLCARLHTIIHDGDAGPMNLDLNLFPRHLITRDQF